MHSFSVNTDHDNETFCDENLIKSLSEDEDEDDDAKLHDDHDFECDLFSASNQQTQNDEMQPHKAAAKGAPEITVHADSEVDEEEMEEHLVLDKDIEIAKVLNEHGYNNLTKLCCTDQGSVWRARSLKQYGNKSVIIKIASKLHYNLSSDEELKKGDAMSSEHENILKEIKLIKTINKAQKESECDVIKNCIIQVIDTFDSPDNFMVVLEDGGMDLFHFIEHCHQQIANGTILIKEWQKTVRLIARKLSKLIHWLHTNMHVCHLDISLENVLISNVSWIRYPDQYKNYKKRLCADFRLKLIDFGAAQQFHRMHHDEDDDNEDTISFDCSSMIGKPTYCCPQIYKLQNRKDAENEKKGNKVALHFDARKADIWSFGISLFIMAIGTYPWTSPDEHGNELFQTIVVDRNLDFILKAWNRFNYMETEMKDLLRKIFVIDEKERICTDDIVQHPWLNCNV
eukprot:CAMPEP_0197027884 /NCGR_PEP_ID=MMETSP1384-20130603/7744_1 /TAXON_ID=29189 /ORGANISM="Ammonia sp." /LENGTH=455 /DNA_ID=CAMNT_0042456803 /DNA_START=178 /DNA_END=1545 /DNA_ORIENTATION=+